MKKNSIITILIVTVSAVLISAVKTETGITGSVTAGSSSTEFILNYTVTNTFGVDANSDTSVIIPFEKYIIHGNIQTGVITEKDILFSQLNVDLNGDGDYANIYNVRILKNEISINEKKLTPLIRRSANYTVMFPYNQGNYSVNKISDKGGEFTLRGFTSNPAGLTIGLTPGQKIEFRKFKNSVVLIEVITAEIHSGRKIIIDGSEPFEGVTNENDLTGGEKYLRFIAAKNIVITNGSGKDSVTIKNIWRPFKIRLSYFFSISENSVLITQKVIEVK